MFLSMSGCDSQLLKLPFFVPAENTEDPRCWVDANGWHGAWGCPCPSSPGGELRPGIKQCFSGVQLISCPPHMARFLSSSLILVLHQPGTACRSVGFLAVGTPAASLAPPPCQDCAGSCPCEDHVCGGGEQPKARKQEKKKLYQTEREKSKEEALKGGRGLQFQERLQGR